LINNGSKSFAEARVRVRKYVRIIQKLGYEVSLDPIKWITSSAVADLEKRLDLLKVRDQQNGSYEPELFNAVLFKREKVHFSCFSTGKVVITGITSKASLRNVVYPLLMELLIEN
jgi:TATA-box binding protein (TBP) (component of TFIID and TFIIIB)